MANPHDTCRLTYDGEPAAPHGTLLELLELLGVWMVAGGQTHESCRSANLTFGRFVRFAGAYDVAMVSAVTEKLVAKFVSAPGANGRPPAIATQHQRRSTIRIALLLASQHDRSITDPTRHLALPSRSTMASRPVTDDELALLRQVSLATLVETRQPSIIALAEIGAVTTEISLVTVEDIDLDRGVVRLPGCSTAAPRVGLFTDWGATQVARRLRHTDTVPCQGLVYQGSGCGNSPQASVSVAFRRMFTQAGLTREKDLGLSSVRAWAGRHAFDLTGRIEDAAAVMGCRTLDGAARLIGWDWTERPQ